MLTTKKTLLEAQKQINKATSKAKSSYFIYRGIIFATGKEPIYTDGSKVDSEYLQEVLEDFKSIPS